MCIRDRLWRFHHDMAAVGGHHQPDAERGGHLRAGSPRPARTQGSSASTLAAQMKSLTEMPPTEWVLKRTVQRL